METSKKRKREYDVLKTLERSEIFKECSDSDLSLIKNHSYVKAFPSGKTIFLKNDVPDGIYIILDGTAEAISTFSDGKEIIFNRMQKGDCFGEIGVFGQINRTATVQAKTRVTAIFIPSLFFQNAEDELSKNFWIAIVKSLCSLLKKKTLYIEDVHHLDAKPRIASLLLSLSNKDKENEQILVSQESLAKMLGLTREMTNKTLMQLQNQKLIKLQRGKIIILDRKNLKSEGEKNNED